MIKLTMTPNLLFKVKIKKKNLWDYSSKTSHFNETLAFATRVALEDTYPFQYKSLLSMILKGIPRKKTKHCAHLNITSNNLATITIYWSTLRRKSRDFTKFAFVFIPTFIAFLKPPYSFKAAFFAPNFKMKFFIRSIQGTWPYAWLPG